MLDRARDDERERRQQQHPGEQILDVGKLEAERLEELRADDVGAARAADEVPVDDQRLHHDRHRERRDGEEDAAQPQRQIAHAEADNARDDAARDDDDGQRHRGELVDRDRRVGAEREERRGAEIHIAAIAAEDVPGGRQHDVLENNEAREVDVVVSQHPRREEHEHGDHKGAGDECRVPHRQRPRMPAGRNDSARNRKPNEIAGAHEGP